MALRTITLASTVDQWKTNYNSLSTDVGDLSLLGTTHDSNLVLAINELIGEFDSATVQRLARKSVSAGTGIGYDSSTGVISLSTPINTITNAMMADSAIGTAELRNSAVTTIKIADNAITFAKMADSSVGTSELRNDAVTTIKIIDNAITFAKMADSSVGTAELRDNAVTFAKMADSSVGTSELRNNAVTYQKMQTITTANRILGSTSAAGAVSEVQIQSAMIASGAVDSASLKSAVITSAKLASAVTLIIYNSAGSALKTLYGAGS
jgi:hypothetical protein